MGAMSKGIRAKYQALRQLCALPCLWNCRACREALQHGIAGNKTILARYLLICNSLLPVMVYVLSICFPRHSLPVKCLPDRFSKEGKAPHIRYVEMQRNRFAALLLDRGDYSHPG